MPCYVKYLYPILIIQKRTQPFFSKNRLQHGVMDKTNKVVLTHNLIQAFKQGSGQKNNSENFAV